MMFYVVTAKVIISTVDMVQIISLVVPEMICVLDIWETISSLGLMVMTY